MPPKTSVQPVDICNFQKMSFVCDGKLTTYSIPYGYKYVLGFAKYGGIIVCKQLCESGEPIDSITVYPDTEDE